MAVLGQHVTDRFAAYWGDCLEVMPTLPDGSIDLSIYSPPFAGLYHYSSSDRDLSNARDYGEFMAHYEFVVAETARLLKPGRIAAVHVMDVPKDGANLCGYVDFPGDVIRLHERHGFEYTPRICIWKEPLAVRNRTMIKALAHMQIVQDSTLTSVASADYLIPFRKKGKNPVPVTHPHGLMSYAGERQASCSSIAAGRATRFRTAIAIGSGGSMRRASGTTCGSIACSPTRRPATATTNATSTPCNST
jgi:hypothetical protein